MTDKYNPFEVEQKWQAAWAKSNAFATGNNSAKPNYYVLEMLPYPSGNLHMGHVRNYTLGDVLARFKRAQGFNVMHPMGWDAFGLPAENAAIKHKTHPAKWTMANIANMKNVMNSFGWSYDWSNEVATCTPEYYGHQQAIFLDMLAKGIVYQKESTVNWDPVDNTVLANEQVVDGKGWRSGAPVERRSMTQWFFKITDYAEELKEDLSQLDQWPNRVRIMQDNWIGYSEGLEFNFDVLDTKDAIVDKLEVYTTRPDTIMGATYCAIAPEHPLAAKTAAIDSQAVSFINECQSLGTSEEAIEKADKKGFKTPYFARHPISGELLPIYIANFVLMSYGSGAIMAVPAHDERDFAFAKKYDLPIKTVICDDNMDATAELTEAYTGPGKVVNSGEFNGMESTTAMAKIIAKFEAESIGKRQKNWRLRDWGVSRQRYWGCPIPVIHCPSCGVVATPKNQLPVELPTDVTFDQPGNPLAHHPTWKHTECPQCGAKAERETDTMDTFVDSSWYFMRYTCAKSEAPLDKTAVNNWLPVNQYIGGIEHAVLHLLYSRFFTKALRDLGYVSFDEPFKALLCQGMVVGHSYKTAAGEYVNPDDINFKDGAAIHAETGEKLTILPMEKISKSKNNGGDPMALLDKYGSDTLRLFMMFTAPPERDLEWSATALDGAWRFLNRLWTLTEKTLENAPQSAENGDLSKDEQAVKRAIHKAIKKVTADVEKFQYNTMIASIMELSNTLSSIDMASTNAPALLREGVEACVRLLNPVSPHITEELWAKLGHNQPLTATAWPTFDAEAATDDEITLIVQLNGKLKERLSVPADISKEDAEEQALTALNSHLCGLTVRKTIVVPGRLVNVVAN